MAPKTESLAEFAREPLLAVAALLLVAVSAAWLVVVRAIARRLGAPLRNYDPRRDLWTVPPPRER
jgi:hypothetical protein